MTLACTEGGGDKGMRCWLSTRLEALKQLEAREFKSLHYATASKNGGWKRRVSETGGKLTMVDFCPSMLQKDAFTERLNTG